jgi:hypothetical protein
MALGREQSPVLRKSLIQSRELGEGCPLVRPQMELSKKT